MSDVRREEDAGDVGAVGAVLRDWDQCGHVPNSDQTPDEDRAVHAVADCSAEERAVGRDGYGGDRFVVFGNKLVAALVLAEVPDSHIAASVTRDELALVRMDYNVVDGDSVRVVTLDVPTTRVPDLDGAYAWRCQLRRASVSS